MMDLWFLKLFMIKWFNEAINSALLPNTGFTVLSVIHIYMMKLKIKLSAGTTQ